MILNEYDPDGIVSFFENHPCPFHEIAPGEPYAGCTCSAVWGQRKATPEEREQNRNSRIQRQERIAKAMRAIGALPVSKHGEASTDATLAAQKSVDQSMESFSERMERTGDALAYEDREVS